MTRGMRAKTSLALFGMGALACLAAAGVSVALAQAPSAAPTAAPGAPSPAPLPAPSAAPSAAPPAATTVAPAAKTAPATGAKSPAQPAKGAKAKPELPELPAAEAPLSLAIVAPSAEGAWTVKLSNTGDKPARVPADWRLLRFELEHTDLTAKKPKVEKTSCSLPDSMLATGFPDSRAVVLKPGETWTERFDPMLFCFGKDAAALRGGTVVRARLGFSKKLTPPPKVAPKKKPTPKGPFAAESLEAPWAFAPATDLFAPTFVLSHDKPDPDDVRPVRIAGTARPRATLKVAVDPADDGTDLFRPRVHVTKSKRFAQEARYRPRTVHSGSALRERDGEPSAPFAKPSEGKAAHGHHDHHGHDGHHGHHGPPGAPVDQNAPRFELEPQKHVEADSARGLSLSITAVLAGTRGTTAALRDRDLSFVVDGPEKTVTCAGEEGKHGVPRELFRAYKPKDKVTWKVMLRERCASDTFSRPGLYRVRTVLDVKDSGDAHGLTAWKGHVEAPTVTWVRVKTGTLPFYLAPPVTGPTFVPTGDGEPLDENGDTPKDADDSKDSKDSNDAKDSKDSKDSKDAKPTAPPPSG